MNSLINTYGWPSTCITRCVWCDVSENGCSKWALRMIQTTSLCQKKDPGDSIGENNRRRRIKTNRMGMDGRNWHVIQWVVIISFGDGFEDVLLNYLKLSIPRENQQGHCVPYMFPRPLEEFAHPKILVAQRTEKVKTVFHFLFNMSRFRGHP